MENDKSKETRQVKEMKTGFDEDGITTLSEAKALLKLQRAVMRTIAELIAFRDGNTGEHIERTQRYLGVLIGALIENDIYAEEVESWNLWLVLNSSLLHDVGKIAVSDSILLKPEKLTDEEFDNIKKHAALGEEIFDKMRSDGVGRAFLEHAKTFAGAHHEKWDGSGYPRGLSGLDIPLLGRIMAIADVYDALVSDRPYKKALTHEQAVGIIIEGRGKHFDPVLVDVFVSVSDQFKKISSICG